MVLPCHALPLPHAKSPGQSPQGLEAAGPRRSVETAASRAGQSPSLAVPVFQREPHRATLVVLYGTSTLRQTGRDDACRPRTNRPGPVHRANHRRPEGVAVRSASSAPLQRCRANHRRPDCTETSPGPRPASIPRGSPQQMPSRPRLRRRTPVQSRPPRGPESRQTPRDRPSGSSKTGPPGATCASSAPLVDCADHHSSAPAARPHVAEPLQRSAACVVSAPCSLAYRDHPRATDCRGFSVLSGG
jgi:hypothetical protein